MTPIAQLLRTIFRRLVRTRYRAMHKIRAYEYRTFNYVLPTKMIEFGTIGRGDDRAISKLIIFLDSETIDKTNGKISFALNRKS